MGAGEGAGAGAPRGEPAERRAGGEGDAPGGARVVPFTKNRLFIYDLLTRAKRFHCSVNGVFEFDVADLLAAISHARLSGRPASLVAALVRATSLLLEKFPRLNHHLFHGPFGRKTEVEFDEISCTLVLMRRGERRERILLPLTLRRSNTLSVEEVQAEIQRCKQAPLDDLPQVAAIRRLERMPRLALSWFSYKARSDWRFYLRHFGTYGLSSLVTRGWGGTSAATLANTASAFLPGTLAPKPVVRDGKVEVRPVLSVLFVADHYIVDGNEMLIAMKHLRRLIETPTLLGLAPPPEGAPPAKVEDDRDEGD
jgi:hypothetical protein